jgi:hypothetical protein
MPGTVAGMPLEGKRLAVAQDGLGLVGVATVGSMQDQGRGIVPAQAIRTARADENARRRQQSLHGDVAPAETDQIADDFFKAVASMDHEQRPCRFQRFGRYG